MRSKQSTPQEPLPPFAALPRSAQVTSDEVVRNPRLLHALWFSLPAIILAFLLGLGLLGLQLSSWLAMRNVNDQQYGAALTSYQRQHSVTSAWPAPWVAQYNLGTTNLLLGNTDEGLGQLADAFVGVPKAHPAEDGTIQTFSYECQVRINLAVGWETLGDAERADGELEQSIASYDTALEWVTPCELGQSESPEDESQSGGGGSSQQQQKEQDDPGSSTSERIEKKRQQAEKEKNGDTESEQPQQGNGEEQPATEEPGQGEDSSEDPFPGESNEERERREALERKNSQQEEQQRERDESAYRDPGTNGW